MPTKTNSKSSYFYSHNETLFMVCTVLSFMLFNHHQTIFLNCFCRCFFLGFTLFTKFLIIPKPTYILVQNPAVSPCLMTCFIAAWIRGSQFAIDWYNLAFIRKAMKYTPKLEKEKKGHLEQSTPIRSKQSQFPLLPSPNHSLFPTLPPTLPLLESPFAVQFSLIDEKLFAKAATVHLCVSEAMKDWLEQWFGVDATVVY